MVSLELALDDLVAGLDKLLHESGLILDVHVDQNRVGKTALQVGLKEPAEGGSLEALVILDDETVHSGIHANTGSRVLRRAGVSDRSLNDTTLVDVREVLEDLPDEDGLTSLHVVGNIEAEAEDGLVFFLVVLQSLDFTERVVPLGKQVHFSQGLINDVLRDMVELSSATEDKAGPLFAEWVMDLAVHLENIGGVFEAPIAGSLRFCQLMLQVSKIFFSIVVQFFFLIDVELRVFRLEISVISAVLTMSVHDKVFAPISLC